MVSKINIRIINPNTKQQLENALEEMIVQELIKNEERKSSID